MASNSPWGNAAAHLRVIHAEEANKLAEREIIKSKEREARAIEEKKHQSKVWAHTVKTSFRPSEDHKCAPYEDAGGWWHSGCENHCRCVGCKKLAKWIGVD